ncbi:MAG: caspase family protein [Planctomycetia bacterium]|nr:caspase family protein [Planctomycetia bacterium]
MKVARGTILWASLMSALCLGQDGNDATTETNPSPVNRWAVVVGIKDYEDENILPLKYADRDAEEFYDLIRTEAGGAFPERQIKKLINKDATTANVTQALRGFLKQAGRDDLVLLFFSCHGAADPDAKSQVVSLLTYDTNADDIASSAVPMREIQHSLEEIVRAENVVILIDACHAGGAIKAKSFTRDAGPTPDLLLAELKKAGTGTAFLMSAGPNQQSFEDDSFHHGVFTHFLLKGIKEELADEDDDDVIRVGELFDYVKKEVQKLKGEKQVPQLNSGANRDFPLAVTNEQSARTRLAIGKQLYELGLDLGEQQLLRSAVRHGEKAAHGYALISGRENLQAEAWMLQGKSLLALDEPANAAKSFAKARTVGGDAKTPEASLYLGIAAAKAGDGAEAQAAVETFVNMHLDTGHEKLRWAEDLANWLKDGPVRRRALLIGVDRQGGETRKNDVDLMKSLLLNQLRFTEHDIKTMINDEVTYLNFDAAVKEMRKVSQPDDHLLVYFSGDATVDSLVLSQPPMILANDSLALVASVAGKKCVILDTSYIDGPTQIADQDADLDLLWAVDDGQEAHESERHGFFTLYLSDVLTGHIGPLTNGSVLAGLRARFASTAAAYSNRSEQIPTFHGDLRKPFLGMMSPIDLFDLNEARSLTDDVGPQLAELYGNYVVDLPEVGFDDIHLNLGRYWLDQPDEVSAKLARGALRRYHEPPQKSARLNAIVSLARAELREGDFDAAATALKRLQEHPQERVQRAVVETLSEIESLRSPGVQALLIGVDKYQNPKLSTLTRRRATHLSWNSMSSC